MDPSVAISYFIDAIPVLRTLWHKVMERHMEIEIKKPYSRAPSNTLPSMISEKPIFEVRVGPNPHIYMWADLVLTNHRPDRRELILQASLHLKKRHWIFWHRTLAQAPIRMHTNAGLEPTGPLLENLAIEPMMPPKTVTVDAKGPITTLPSRLPKKMALYLEFRMIGPIRKMSRFIDTVNHNPHLINRGS